MAFPAPNVPSKQTAAVFEKNGGEITIRTDHPVADPSKLAPGEAIVKLEYSGVCHTDLHAWKGDWPLDNKLPLVGGHEGVGKIVAINEFSETDLKIGDRVGIKWIAASCNRCEFCRQGNEPLCARALCSGFAVDGTFQQHALGYTSQLTPIPDGLSSADAAPILCAGVTVYKALKQTGCTPGQTICIPGAGGGLGHLALQYATAMGFNTISIDTGSEKKDLCAKLGSDKFVDFKTTEDLVGDVKKHSRGGLGVDAAIVAAASPGAYEQALEYIRPGGTLVAVGLPVADIKANVFWTVFLQKRIQGSYVGNRQDAIEALDFAARGQVKCHYKVLPLKDLPSVYGQMADGTLAGRIVLKID